MVMTRDEDVTQSLFYRSAVANKKMLETEVAELNGRLTELDEDIVKLEEELNTAKETQVELQTLKGQRESLENELKDGECQDLAEAKKDQETEDTGETKAIEKPDEVEGSEEVEVAKVVEEDKKAKEAELQTINAEITELGTPKDPEAIGSQIEVKKDEQKRFQLG